MIVKTEHLIPGCIVKKDVFCKTTRPIMAKNTVLTNDLINILKLFLVGKVQVDKTLVNGQAFLPKEFEREEIEVGLEKDFNVLFLNAVQEYKKQFQKWQAGMPIEISDVRNLILPLLEDSKVTSADIFSLYHLSIHEEYFFQHAVAVGLFSSYIARKLNYSLGDIVQIALAGVLADCGMAKIPQTILKKTSTLTPQEFEEIKNHTKYSYNLIQQTPLLKEGAKVAIFQHHERLDGSGYPLGVKGNQIHEFAKIIGVADTFHAMSSERLYKKKQSPFKVLELMQQDYFGKYDLTVLKALSSGVITFSRGSQVILSNGLLAEVLFISEKSPTRPLIKLTETQELLNLEENRHLFIEEIL